MSQALLAPPTSCMQLSAAFTDPKYEVPPRPFANPSKPLLFTKVRDI